MDEDIIDVCEICREKMEKREPDGFLYCKICGKKEEKQEKET
jgi:ribosomal protein L37AE/L43A